MVSRRLNLSFAVLGLLMAAFVLTFVDMVWRGAEGSAATSGRLVAQLGLTDLCLFTEARYTRHPSQADLNTAFQDHPMALEHFPSGALLPPPRSLTDSHAYLDRETAGAD